MRLALPLLAFALLALAAYAPSPAQADRLPGPRADTSEWENLQVLPDTISHDALIAIMRGFTASLGVRCDHCHARAGEELDFPSDANPHKDIARAMMAMTWQINTEGLAGIEGLHNPPDLAAGPAGWAVTCWTCHRGETIPAAHMPPQPEGDGPPPPPADSTHGHDGDDHEHDDGQMHRHDDGTMHRHDDDGHDD